MMSINEMAHGAYKNSTLKGFHDEYMKLNTFIGDRPELAQTLHDMHVSQHIALIQSELSEGLEGLRRGDKDNFAEELADAIIRIGDLATMCGINLEEEVITKMRINESRPRKHGKRF